MYVFLKGGIQPCDECKKIGIAVVEGKSDADRELTGRRWLMKKEAIKKILADDSMLSIYAEYIFSAVLGTNRFLPLTGVISEQSAADNNSFSSQIQSFRSYVPTDTHRFSEC